MKSYLASIAERMDREDTSILLGEIKKAFDEAPADSQARQIPRARELYELVRFCWFDGIAPWLKNERDAVARALAFAQQIGDTKVAAILAAALNCTPQPAVQFSVTIPGHEPQQLDVDAGEVTRFDGKDWGGTDIALSFAMEGFMEAVLTEVVSAYEEFDLQPPHSVRQRAAADQLINKSTNDASAAALFRTLVSAENPRMLVGDWDDGADSPSKGRLEIAVEHEVDPPADTAVLASLRAKYGSVIQELLDVYACHNGAALFKYEGECGFYIGPIAEWDELLGRATEWAEGVTWQDDKNAIPSYLYSAIAFGMIPGDSERWLFITEGPHAGKIMLSDTDLIDEKPRFESLAQFFATLLNDAGRVLNCGGYVRYVVDDAELFPVRYLTK